MNCKDCKYYEYCRDKCMPYNGCYPPWPPLPPLPPKPEIRRDLGGIQAQLTGLSGVLALEHQNILFDAVLNQSNTSITYDSSTGEFLLAERKNYYVSWWAAIDGTEVTSTIAFAVALGGTPISSAMSPQVTAQLSGSALVTVGNHSDRLSIINTSGNTVRYAETEIQAGIVLVEIGSLR